MKYKFRAECIEDILKLRRESAGKITALAVVFDDNLPDVVATFESDKNQIYLETIFDGIVDGHVMLETLNIEDKYTGERAEPVR